MRATADYTAKTLDDLSAGMHAFGMNRGAPSMLQALKPIEHTFYGVGWESTALHNEQENMYPFEGV